MSIVHIAFKYGLNNTDGAAIASTRLHQALLASGEDSHYVCVWQYEQGANVYVLPSGWRRKLYFALTKFTRCIWRFTLYRRFDLVEVLKLLPHEIVDHTEVHVFGEDGSDDVINNISIKVLGDISDPARLLDIYHQGDVFAFPSRLETQGMTKCEALCCGLPVIAFDRTACAEGIEHGLTGWIAPDGDLASFARGIEWAYQLFAKGQLTAHRCDIAKMKRSQFETTKIIELIKRAYAD